MGDRAQQIGGAGNDLVDGITVEVINKDWREKLGVPEKLEGVIVTKADPKSPYSRYLQPRMVILEINDRRVRGISEARNALRRGVNKLYIYHEGRTGYLALRVR